MNPPPSPTPTRSKKSDLGRRAFRLLKFAAVTLVLCLAGLFLYLRAFGLPDYCKNLILTELKSHGFNLEVKTLKLGWTGQIIAKQFGTEPSDLSAFRWTINRAEIQVGWGSLLALNPKVHSVFVREAHVEWPVTTNQDWAMPALNLNRASFRLLFEGQQRWILTNFTARLWNLPVEINGILTHPEHLGGARKGPRTNQVASLWLGYLEDLRQMVEKSQLDSKPSLALNFNFNARDPAASSGTFAIREASGTYRGFNFNGLTVRASYQPPAHAAGNATLQLAAQLNTIARGAFRATGLVLEGNATNLASAGQAALSLRAQTVANLNPSDLVADKPARSRPWTAGGNDWQVAASVSGKSWTNWAKAWPEQLTWQLAASNASVAFHDPARVIQSGQLTITGSATNSTPGGQLQAALNYSVQDLRSPWLSGRRFDGTNSLAAALPPWFPGLRSATNRLENAAGLALERWLRTVALTNQTLVFGLDTPAGAGQQANLEFHIAPRQSTLLYPTNPIAGFWTNLAPYTLEWDFNVREFEARRPGPPPRTAPPDYLPIHNLQLAGSWGDGQVDIHRLFAEVADGEVDLRCNLDVEYRRARAEGRVTCDVPQLGPLFGTNTQAWLKQFSWLTPPEVNVEASITLPPWHRLGQKAAWQDEAMPSFFLSGFLTASNAAFRGASMASVSLRFISYDGFWHLEELSAQNPSGNLVLTYCSDSGPDDYTWAWRSEMDPGAALLLATDSQREFLNRFEWSQPPQVTGCLTDQWRSDSPPLFEVKIQAGNFRYQGQDVRELHATLLRTDSQFAVLNAAVHMPEEEILIDQIRYGFTNNFLRANEITFRKQFFDQISAWLKDDETSLVATNIQVLCEGRPVKMEGLRYDKVLKQLHMTNGLTQAWPPNVAAAIGPKTAQSVEPYRFPSNQPPDIKVNGFLTVPGPYPCALEFQVDGGPFSFSKFNLDQVSGRVGWTNETMRIGNFTGSFYGGSITGGLTADFSVPKGSDLDFFLAVENSEIRDILSDLSIATNKVSGKLDLVLTNAHANATDWNSWQGNGRITLRNSALGMMLLARAATLAKNPNENATASFTITNSVVRSDNLKIHLPTVRIAGSGEVHILGTNLNARIEAYVLRDTWVLGQVVSVLFSPITKAFVYRLSGSVNKLDIKSESIYLAPVNAVKGMFGRDKEPPRKKNGDSPLPDPPPATNQPPVLPPRTDPKP